MKHLFPGDLVVENETAAALRRVLAYLEEHGWCQGTATNDKGNSCIEYAFQIVGGGLNAAAFDHLIDIVREIGGVSFGGLAVWNDDSLTTWPMVRMALLKAIEAACLT